MSDSRETSQSLAQWQWSLYPHGHADRRNLLLHITTVPLFWAGTLISLSAPFTAWWYALVGLAVMAGVIALQGRTHKLEQVKPVPFRGTADVFGRIFTEQWFTFPRYVVTGGFAKAWREADSRRLQPP